MHTVVMLLSAGALKKNFFPIRLPVAVVVIKIPHIRALRYNNSVSQHADSKWRIDFRSLIEYRLLIQRAVLIGIFKNKYAISGIRGGVSVERRPVIVRLGYPNPATIVHIDISGVY